MGCFFVCFKGSKDRKRCRKSKKSFPVNKEKESYTYFHLISLGVEIITNTSAADKDLDEDEDIYFNDVNIFGINGDEEAYFSLPMEGERKHFLGVSRPKPAIESNINGKLVILYKANARDKNRAHFSMAKKNPSS